MAAHTTGSRRRVLPDSLSRSAPPRNPCIVRKRSCVGFNTVGKPFGIEAHEAVRSALPLSCHVCDLPFLHFSVFLLTRGHFSCSPGNSGRDGEDGKVQTWPLSAPRQWHFTALRHAPRFLLRDALHQNLPLQTFHICHKPTLPCSIFGRPNLLSEDMVAYQKFAMGQQ